MWAEARADEGQTNMYDNYSEKVRENWTKNSSSIISLVTAHINMFPRILTDFVQITGIDIQYYVRFSLKHGSTKMGWPNFPQIIELSEFFSQYHKIWPISGL